MHEHTAEDAPYFAAAADGNTPPPLLFAQLAIDHSAGMIGVAITGSVNTSAIGAARTRNMPEIIQVSVFAAVSAQQGRVIFRQQDAPLSEQLSRSQSQGMRGAGGTRGLIRSDPSTGEQSQGALVTPKLGLEFPRAYRLQVPPPALRNTTSSGEL